jgi:hypothetical protein
LTTTGGLISGGVGAGAGKTGALAGFDAGRGESFLRVPQFVTKSTIDMINTYLIETFLLFVQAKRETASASPGEACLSGHSASPKIGPEAVAGTRLLRAAGQLVGSLALRLRHVPATAF